MGETTRPPAATTTDRLRSPMEICWQFDYAIDVEKLRNLFTKAKEHQWNAERDLDWDVALDPAMGAGFPVWRWQVEGFFYSMPAINWVGWFVTALIIAWGYETLAGVEFREPSRWTVPLWILNGAFPLGILLVQSLGAAALAGTLALAIPVLAVWSRGEASRNSAAG